MEANADPHDRMAPGPGGLSTAITAGHRPRTGTISHLLRELQHEARDVFACSGETVDRFLRDRRNEAQHAAGAPA